MDLPINNEELGTIVKALTLGGDTALYQKLKLVKETIDENPGGPYKSIWSKASSLCFAAVMYVFKDSTISVCPIKSSKWFGLICLSKFFSSLEEITIFCSSVTTY